MGCYTPHWDRCPGAIIDLSWRWRQSYLLALFRPLDGRGFGSHLSWGQIRCRAFARKWLLLWHWFGRPCLIEQWFWSHREKNARIGPPKKWIFERTHQQSRCHQIFWKQRRWIQIRVDRQARRWLYYSLQARRLYRFVSWPTHSTHRLYQGH